MPSSPARVQPGSQIRLHLAIRLDDDTEVLSTFGEEPVHCRLGDGSLTAGLEGLIIGLPSGADTELRVAGQRLFGAPDPAKVYWLPRGEFAAIGTPEPGQVMSFDTGAGEETLGLVRTVEEDRVEVDFNHPLSAAALSLRILVLSVDAAEGENP